MGSYKAAGKNIPNYLTISRILAVPFVIATFYLDNSKLAHQLGAIIFALASITDFLDGFIARRYNITSNFGRMFDPIADKLLVGCVLIMLVSSGKAHAIPAILILSREFLVSGFREFLSSTNFKIPVSRFAQVKTFMQMAAITMLILGTKGSGIKYIDEVGMIILWTAALMTIATGLLYYKACKEYLERL